MKKKYTIPLRPIPWQRARLNGKKFFDNQAHEKNAYGLYLAQQHDSLPLFENPIKVEINFYFTKAKHSKKTHHTSPPDIDNCIKFAFDAMKDVVLSDDRIVCALIAKKLYDDTARTEITITEVE